MALKHCVVLLFINLWQTTIGSESDYFCFVIRPAFKLKVTNQALFWGKWIAGFENYEEVDGPYQGEVIEAYSSKTICSSGRQGSASGTEGYVKFKDEHHRYITVKWNNPWGLSEEYTGIDHDKEVFYVSIMTKNGQWYLDYTIVYEKPNTLDMSKNVNYTIPWSRYYYDKCLKNSCENHFGRPRRDVSDDDDDDDSFCESTDEADNADYHDHLITHDIYQGVTSAEPGTVHNDAISLEQEFPPVEVQYDAQRPSPIRRYSTVYFPELDLRLPIVVRARINSRTVAAAGRRNPSGIRNAANELTEALKKVKSEDSLSYHVGHMVAWVLGGPDAAYNFAPQTAYLNLGKYKKMESNVKKFVKDHPEGWVDMTVVVYYWRGTFMPIAFGVNLVYYFSREVLASSCRDTMFWNQRPYPPNPPAIG